MYWIQSDAIKKSASSVEEATTTLNIKKKTFSCDKNMCIHILLILLNTSFPTVLSFASHFISYTQPYRLYVLIIFYFGIKIKVENNKK